MVYSTRNKGLCIWPPVDHRVSFRRGWSFCSAIKRLIEDREGNGDLEGRAIVLVNIGRAELKKPANLFEP